MALQSAFQDVAYPIPVSDGYGSYSEYLISYYVPAFFRTATINIGGQEWPTSLITTTSRFDNFLGTKRYHYIERERNSSLSWPPVRKAIIAQNRDIPFVNVNEGDLPLFYGTVEDTPNLGVNNFPQRNWFNTQYIDYVTPSSGNNWEGGLQSMWFITPSDHSTGVILSEAASGSDNQIASITWPWDLRIVGDGEPVVRDVSEVLQVLPLNPPVRFDPDAEPIPRPDEFFLPGGPPTTPDDEFFGPGDLLLQKMMMRSLVLVDVQVTSQFSPSRKDLKAI